MQLKLLAFPPVKSGVKLNHADSVFVSMLHTTVLCEGGVRSTADIDS